MRSKQASQLRSALAPVGFISADIGVAVPDQNGYHVPVFLKTPEGHTHEFTFCIVAERSRWVIDLDASLAITYRTDPAMALSQEMNRLQDLIGSPSRMRRSVKQALEALTDEDASNAVPRRRLELKPETRALLKRADPIVRSTKASTVKTASPRRRPSAKKSRKTRR